MKRLVYAPRAYVFVRTDDYGIINLSDYVTSGQVNRVINAASTAEVQLRNPDMVWTRGARQGKPIFRPMDPITIWLERIRGYPVQAFTGYLDRTPYLQLYPGVCRISASCTLKRLIHTYWDPALTFTNIFMQKYGWTGDYKSGMLINSEAEQANFDAQNLGDPKLTDGSIGELMFAVLKNVADWPAEGIWIERVPSEIIPKVRAIYESFAEGSAEIDKAIEGFIKKYIGDGVYGAETSGDGGGGGGGADSTGTVKGADRIIPIMVAEANRNNIPPAFPIAVSLHECRLDGSAVNPDTKATGWFQWLPFAGRGAPGSYVKCGYSEKHKFGDATDLGIATHAFCRSAALALKKQRSFQDDWIAWAEYVQGAVGQLNSLPTFVKQAKDLISKHGDMVERAAGDAAQEVADAVAQTGGKLKTHSDSGTKSTPTLRPISMPLPGGTYGARSGSPKIIVLHSTEGHNRPGTTDLSTLFDVLKNQGLSVHVGNDAEGNCARYCSDDKKAFHVTSYNNAALGIEQIGFAAQGSWPNKQIENTAMWIAHWAKKYDIPLKRSTEHGVCTHKDLGAAGGGHVDPGPAYPFNKVLTLAGSYSGIKVEGDDGSTDSSGGGAGGGAAGVPYDTILSAAKATAFVQSLEFPSLAEHMEAQGLKGAKSLMNDKPLLPFIEQLAGAALRSFQSLPNGDFYAFYPDYFGNMTNSKPYWLIDDVEILDAGIDLSDDALATHVFAVGDTTLGASPEFNRLRSTGVVNIFNVARSGFTTAATEHSSRAQQQTDEATSQTARDRIISDPTQVVEFLKKYGARPHVEDAPMIRSQFFEAFMAWHQFHQLWSRQFLTEFSFTFMPELFPGGLVGFPNHGVQCYIDQVTHNWDYTSGFETTAQLSAPASLSGDKNTTDPLQFGMVKAAGGK